MCLKAKKALYGLPQSPRLWNRKFTAWLATQGFSPTKKDPCYYILREGGEEIHLICDVDDLAFAGSSTEVLEAFKGALNRQFKMKDMGQLNWFLGCEVKQDLVNGTTTLVQTKYIHETLRPPFLLQENDHLHFTFLVSRTPQTPMNNKIGGGHCIDHS